MKADNINTQFPSNLGGSRAEDLIKTHYSWHDNLNNKDFNNEQGTTVHQLLSGIMEKILHNIFANISSETSMQNEKNKQNV